MYRALGMLWVLVASTAHALDFENLNWKKELQKDNLVVYLAEAPNSDIKAFKATSIYDTSIDQLVSAITDMDHFTEWSEGAVRSDVIKTEGNSQWCYYVNKFPWPYKNRDGVVIQTVIKESEDKVTIHLSTDRDIEEPREDMVRITELLGNWNMKKLAANKTEVTYEVHMEPTGTLPSWVVNMMLSAAPKNTLTNLHKVDFSRYHATPSLYVQK